VLLGLALFIAIGLALWVQGPRLTNPNETQDDFRGYYWFNLFQEPDLYPTDLNPANYRNTELQLFGLEFGLLFDILNNLRAGYHLLFFLASPLVPPILFNKLLIFPLILILAYYAFRIGQKLKGEWTGFALAMTFVVFNLASGDSITVATGLPRAFAFPILLALVYYLLTQRLLAAGIVVAVAAIIYPPAFVLSLATYILAALGLLREGTIRIRFSWRMLVPFAVLGAIALILVPKIAAIVSVFWTGLTDNWGNWGLLNHPLYRTGGRYHLFEQYFFIGRGGIFTKISNFWQTLALFFVALGSWLLTPRQDRLFPKTLKQLLIAAVACFIAAWAAIILASRLTLYYPSRYLRAAIPIVLLILAVTNMEQALLSARSRLQRLTLAQRAALALVLAAWSVTGALLFRQQLLPIFKTIPDQTVEWLLIFASAFTIGALMLLIFGSIQGGKEPWTSSWSGRVVVVLLVCLLAGAGAYYVMDRKRGYGFLPLSNSQLEYLDFVQALPKDAKLASGSCVLENIPMFARRQALWHCENMSASKTVMLVDTLKAYYAASLDDVINYCRQYEVDYIVISREAFEGGRVRIGDYPFAPYSSFLTAEADPRARHVLSDIPDSMRVYENEDLIVMQCELKSEQAVEATQVDGLSFLVHDDIPKTLSQKGEVEMTVKWIADKEMSTDYDVCFSVEDRSGEVRQEICEPLSSDLPSSRWPIPAIWYETYNFRISPYLEDGAYSIVASVDPAEEADRSSGVIVGEFDYTTLSRTISPVEIDPKSDYDALWGDVIALADYNVTESDLNTLDVNASWHALQRMPESYKVFVHLRRAGTGEIVSQVDTIPRNWTYPTDWWEANEIITDTLSIPLGDLEPGRFEVWLGFYNEESGERLPLADPITLSFSTDENAVNIYEFER
jgi:hypothetical protein